MIVLGIETSTAVCSVALRHTDGRCWERRVVESHIHSEKLLTLVQEVCADAQIVLAALDGVAVSSGPGSFTGLRIGMSAAKGLCLGLAKPLLVVPSFEAIAEAAFVKYQEAKFLAVCLDARQGDFYIGRFRFASGHAHSIDEVRASSIRSLMEGQTVDVVVTDREKSVREVLPAVLNIVDVLELCNASPVAMIGQRMLSEGRIADLASAEPAYLKDFVVRTGSITSH